jgi:hypothetical protein
LLLQATAYAAPDQPVSALQDRLSSKVAKYFVVMLFSYS